MKLKEKRSLLIILAILTIFVIAQTGAFDSISLSVTCGSGSAVTLTAYTNPVSGGTISIDNRIYTNGQSRLVCPKSIPTISANTNSGYTFNSWSNAGGSLSSTSSTPTTIKILGASASITANFATTNSCPYTYTIKAGDTFYGLATTYGTTVTAIQNCNPSVNPASLFVGQVIQFPVSTNINGAPYFGIDQCSQASGCPLSVGCSTPSSDSISTTGFSNAYDSCFLGAAALFVYNAAFVKAEGFLESGLKPTIYSQNDNFPGPCGYSGWDPLNGYASQDASHSYGLLQLTPQCVSDSTGNWFATYSPSQASALGYSSCQGTGSNMQLIPATNYFYCAPQGYYANSAQYVAGYYADVSTDSSNILYQRSAYNPAYNIFAYVRAVNNIFNPTIAGGINNGAGDLTKCTANQQWYIVIAAYNQGSIYSQLKDANGQGAKCVLDSTYNNGNWNGYNYVNQILTDYAQMYGNRGPFASFPNS